MSIVDCTTNGNHVKMNRSLGRGCGLLSFAAGDEEAAGGEQRQTSGAGDGSGVDADGAEVVEAVAVVVVGACGDIQGDCS